MHAGSLESTRLRSVELPEARARLLTLPILECPKNFPSAFTSTSI